jgi:DNA-directed RNA polymerase specialized sigma24 family protein
MSRPLPPLEVAASAFFRNPAARFAQDDFYAAFLRLARSVLGHGAAPGSDLHAEVVEEVWERVVTAALTGANTCGRAGERRRYLAASLRNLAIDRARRRRAYHGARATVDWDDPEARFADRIAGDAPSAEDALVAAEAPAVTAALLRRLYALAEAHRAVHNRPALAAAWAAFCATTDAGLSVEAWLVAEAAAQGVPLTGPRLVAERDRVQKSLTRLKRELRAMADRLGAVAAGGPDPHVGTGAEGFAAALASAAASLSADERDALHDWAWGGHGVPHAG